MIENAATLFFPEKLDAIVTIQKNIVVTSGTHMLSLEMLEVDQTLIGFPNLGYISSKKKQGINSPLSPFMKKYQIKDNAI